MGVAGTRAQLAVLAQAAADADHLAGRLQRVPRTAGAIREQTHPIRVESLHQADALEPLAQALEGVDQVGPQVAAAVEALRSARHGTDVIADRSRVLGTRQQLLPTSYPRVNDAVQVVATMTSRTRGDLAGAAARLTAAHDLLAPGGRGTGRALRIVVDALDGLRSDVRARARMGAEPAALAIAHGGLASLRSHALDLAAPSMREGLDARFAAAVQASAPDAALDGVSEATRLRLATSVTDGIHALLGSPGGDAGPAAPYRQLATAFEGGRAPGGTSGVDAGDLLPIVRSRLEAVADELASGHADLERLHLESHLAAAGLEGLGRAGSARSLRTAASAGQVDGAGLFDLVRGLLDAPSMTPPAGRSTARTAAPAPVAPAPATGPAPGGPRAPAATNAGVGLDDLLGGA